MIIDKIKIYLKAGDGGEGSFSSMKFSSRRVIGGGGDGGKGGDVILKVSPHLYDLIKFNERRKFVAEDGGKGKEFNKKGKNGIDMIVNVPKGTQILDLDGNVIVDLCEDDQEYLICKGGLPGRGNYKKMYSLPAGKGEAKEVILYYCIPNDVAIVGFANSGKTSLFNKLSGKEYKVADYPFTTKACVWAPIEVGYKRFVIMDTPAIKGSSDNLSVQNIFLKHLFRSKIILLVSDNHADFDTEFKSLKKDISSFEEVPLKGKKFFYLLNKVDKIDKNRFDLKGIIAVSSTDNTGIEELKKRIIKCING